MHSPFLKRHGITNTIKLALDKQRFTQPYKMKINILRIIKSTKDVIISSILYIIGALNLKMFSNALSVIVSLYCQS